MSEICFISLLLDLTISVFLLELVLGDEKKFCWILCACKYVCVYICIILYTFIVSSLALMLSITKNKPRTIRNTPPHPHQCSGVFKYVVENSLCLYVFLSLSGTGR